MVDCGNPQGFDLIIISTTREGSLLILLWISAHQRFIKLSLPHSDLPSLLFGLLSGFPSRFQAITTFRVP